VRTLSGAASGFARADIVTKKMRQLNSLALLVQEALRRDPHGGDLHVFHGRSGKLIKVLWHDGLGMSLYAKRLERGKFI
jgi:transposase